MALIASDSGGGTPVPQGVHTGRCFRVIDLGTQPREYQGQVKPPIRKAMLAWELYGEDEEGNPLLTEDGRPLAISKRYSVSLSDKATLRADLESWRGKAFTNEELKGFDISKLIGVTALINVKHEDRDGKTYANVASISPVPKAMRDSLPLAVNKPQLFDVTDPDMALFDTLSEKLRETIKGCVEWKKQSVSQAASNTAVLAERMRAGTSGWENRSAPPDDDIGPPTDDDIPW